MQGRGLVLRFALAGLAAVLNGFVLMAPAVLAGRNPWQDAGLTTAVAALCLVVAAETWCWLPVSGQGERVLHDDLALLNWAQGLGLLISFLVAVLWHLDHPGGVGMMGLGLVGAGAILRVMAISRLGAGFTNSGQPGRDVLCSDGIYGWMRHPGESGLILIYTGFPLMIVDWPVAAVIVSVLLVLSVLRIRAEDRGLAQTFPDAYADYRRRVRL